MKGSPSAEMPKSVPAASSTLRAFGPATATCAHWSVTLVV